MSDFDLFGAFIPALQKPAELLPVAKHRESLLYAIETHPVTIVVGQTGSGKTTQIPQYLDRAGWCADGKMIGVTQPRRVAATTVAIRVAEEVGCEVGQEVGYAIRFGDATSAQTRIKILTDGLLLREALADPLLTRYSVVMVDEAHERTVSTDLLLGLLKRVLRRRPELRVIVSSATMQAEEMRAFFDSPEEDGHDGDRKTVAHDSVVEQTRDGTLPAAVIVSVVGRTFPVEVLYMSLPVEDYVERAVETVLDIHAREQDDGDILVFLTGHDEIGRAAQLVSERHDRLVSGSGVGARTLTPLALHAGLTAEQQAYVFAPTPAGTRKAVFATNVAEASVTLDGVVHVVDCGLVKLRVYDAGTGVDALVKTAVSKASARQRAGRAGRTRPGRCLRLYTEEAFRALQDTTPAETRRSNLVPAVLLLKALGVDNVARFTWPPGGAPGAAQIARALELLFALGALDEQARLTRPIGERMAELGLEPMMARALLAAVNDGCAAEMLTIAAMSTAGGSAAVWPGEARDADTARRRFAADEGDQLTMLNVFSALDARPAADQAAFCRENRLSPNTMARAAAVRTQLRRQLERLGMRVDGAGDGVGRGAADGATMGTRLRRCLARGYFAHAARMQPDGTFRGVGGGDGGSEGMVMYAHPSSVMFHRSADWVVFHEAVHTAGKTFIRDVCKAERVWLVESAAGFYVPSA